jgi:hypothetical protein
MAITSNEFHGMSKGKKGKKSAGPTVKAPKMSKEGKAVLVPYGNQAPARRANVAYS